MITETRRALEFLIKDKSKNVSNLKKVHRKVLSDMKFMDYLRVKGNNYEVTNRGERVYKNIYSKPTLGESMMGLFCKYVLRH
jgi:hypothetical protein